MKTKIIAVTIGAIILISGGVYLSIKNSVSLPSQTGEETPQEEPTAEIDSELFRIEFQTLEGETVTLADYEDTPLVVNSWASWCSFCVKELPDFATAGEEFQDQVVIIAINRRESQEQNTNYIENLGISGEIIYLLDEDDSFYKAIGGFGIPETLFINAAGETVIHKRGPMELDEIQDKIKQVL